MIKALILDKVHINRTSFSYEYQFKLIGIGDTRYITRAIRKMETRARKRKRAEERKRTREASAIDAKSSVGEHEVITTERKRTVLTSTCFEADADIELYFQQWITLLMWMGEDDDYVALRTTL